MKKIQSAFLQLSYRFCLFCELKILDKFPRHYSIFSSRYQQVFQAKNAYSRYISNQTAGKDKFQAAFGTRSWISSNVSVSSYDPLFCLLWHSWNVFNWYQCQHHIACNFPKINIFHGCLSRFLNCTNGTKSRNAPHILLNCNVKSSPVVHHEQICNRFNLLATAVLRSQSNI